MYLGGVGQSWHWTWDLVHWEKIKVAELHDMGSEEERDIKNNSQVTNMSNWAHRGMSWTGCFEVKSISSVLSTLDLRCLWYVKDAVGSAGVELAVDKKNLGLRFSIWV